MTWSITKVLISAIVISFVSWLSGKRPVLAGFLMALPLTTMLALAFSQSEFRDSGKTVQFAKSVFFAVPLSLLFFVPFLCSDRLKLSFWTLYAMGALLLTMGYFIHTLLLKG